MEQLTKAVSRALSQNLQTNPTSPKALCIQSARMLLGCYRTGDANDPEVYVTAIVHVLSHYPEDVVARVVDPMTGLPGRLKWLPSVQEVRAACDEVHGLQCRIREYDERSKKQLAEREANKSASA